MQIILDFKSGIPDVPAGTFTEYYVIKSNEYGHEKHPSQACYLNEYLEDGEKEVLTGWFYDNDIYGMGIPVFKDWSCDVLMYAEIPIINYDEVQPIIQLK